MITELGEVREVIESVLGAAEQNIKDRRNPALILADVLMSIEALFGQISDGMDYEDRVRREITRIYDQASL